MFDESNIHDVEFTEEKTQREIRGSVLYYSTGQVSQILGIPDSTIRYYTKVFDPILNIEVFNKQRKYTDSDIDKLKFIIELKNEGMTVRQILEYAQSGVDFNSENGIQVKESNPLSIQTLAKALMEQQQIEFDKLKEELFKRTELQIAEITKHHLEYQDKLKDSVMEEVSITVDEVLNERFDSLKEQLEDIKQEVKVATVSLESIKEFENPKTFISKITNLFSKR